VSEDQLGPDLKDRLRAQLDRVQPLNSAPRYRAAPPRPTTLRLAPAVLGVSVVAILALSAFVATGSPNPAVWGHDAVTIIQSSSTTPTPTPKAAPTQKPQPTPTHKVESSEPTERPKPGEPGEHHVSPQPSDDHSGTGSGSVGDGDSFSHDGSGSSGGDSHDGGTSDSGDTERS
jgi:hypothetical protein